MPYGSGGPVAWRVPVYASALALALCGCSRAPREAPATVVEVPAVAPAAVPAASALQGALVASAADLLGTRAVVSGDQRIGQDCAGVVRAVYLAHGIDLYAGVDDGPSVNGVRRIHQHVARYGRLHPGPTPLPGDLVFFDDTWDFNGDGLANDPLTHIGLVERIEADGTVLFISRVTRAVERYRMNLAHPHQHRAADGRILNDYLRRKRPADRSDVRHLTGELFAGFGTRVE
jgi:hypothetical protein